ncbi:hypothetical protein Bbelb_207490 [Branchiostoma belcheri]|nr:hypothetical protein Bbelb_207490 [Branchiostoma belcheri]
MASSEKDVGTKSPTFSFSQKRSNLRERSKVHQRIRVSLQNLDASDTLDKLHERVDSTTADAQRLRGLRPRQVVRPPVHKFLDPRMKPACGSSPVRLLTQGPGCQPPTHSSREILRALRKLETPNPNSGQVLF